MKVKVVPKRPIPGILPKNKWIDKEMELDLNVQEIKYCMGFGVIYHDNELVDEVNIYKIDQPKKQIPVAEVIPEAPKAPVMRGPIVGYRISQPIKPEVVKLDEEVKEESIKPVEIINSLKQVSCVKEENYTILEFEFNTTGEKVGNDLEGRFNINAGSKVEYKSVNDKWVKFNSKFATLNELEDGTKFVFRFTPNHKSLLKYVLSIKDNIGFDVKIAGSIDQSEL